jgi:TolB-like protein
MSNENERTPPSSDAIASTNGAAAPVPTERLQASVSGEPPTQMRPPGAADSASDVATAQRAPDAGAAAAVQECSALRSDGPASIGQTLGGRYRIERELGEGGMGMVYLAMDEQIAGEIFAIKVLKAGLPPEAVTLLRQEVQRTRKLSHPNIVDMHSVNRDGTRLYVLMEYLEGKALSSLLDEEYGRGMPWSRAWPIIEDVGAALAHAHNHSLVHSDLKPANIFVTTAGKTKLLDFGIARASRGRAAHAGPRALTPAYASCEMLEGREPDARDDIYSFGCVIYEMLSGRRPFGGCSAIEARKYRIALEPLPSLSREQNAALARALAFDRKTRAASVEELLAGLRELRTPSGGRSALFASGLTALLAMAAVGYFALDRFGLLPRSASIRSAAGSAATIAPPPQSIAVLPLVNESGEPSQQYFSDGISEDLITALSQFQGLKVIGRTSAFHFRDSKEDSRSIGAKLGVAHLLEGSMRRSGEMVRVSAELIDTTDGSTQWSERYDRPYKDLFALQDEITGAVVVALRAKLLPGAHALAQSDRPPSGSLEAYNALLQGRFYFGRETEADLRKAIEYYTQATLLDPRYAFAWSGLSRAWTKFSGDFLGGAPAQEAYAKARATADRALALSPDLAAAHLAQGSLLMTSDFDWRGGEAEYRRALTLAPNDGAAQASLGNALANLGELEQAIELLRQAIVTEPLRANSYGSISYYLSALNRLDEAERAASKAIELQPTPQFHAALTLIEIKRGHAQAALTAAQHEPPGIWQDVVLAYARQIGTDRSAADAALRNLIDKDANLAAYQIAAVYALRNDAKATFEWLDRAWSNRDPGIHTLLFDPFILRYRDDPRFAAFCRKVGLPMPGEVPARKPPVSSTSDLPRKRT